MRTLAPILALLALAACQSLPHVVVTGGDTFDVRYDSETQSADEADARAERHCGAAAELVSEEIRFDGFAYRTYRCAGST